MENSDGAFGSPYPWGSWFDNFGGADQVGGFCVGDDFEEARYSGPGTVVELDEGGLPDVSHFTGYCGHEFGNSKR